MKRPPSALWARLGRPATLGGPLPKQIKQGGPLTGASSLACRPQKKRGVGAKNGWVRFCGGPQTHTPPQAVQRRCSCGLAHGGHYGGAALSFYLRKRWERMCLSKTFWGGGGG